MTSRRLYAPTVLLLLAAGGAAFFAMSRPWVDLAVHTAGLPVGRVTIKGSQAHPLLSALSVVIVAAALGILATSKRLRRVIGVLVVVIGISSVAVIATGADAVRSKFESALVESPSFSGGRIPDISVWSPWAFVAIAFFTVAVGLGIMVLVGASGWPTMSSRYDAPSKRSLKAPTELDHMDQADIWKALDDGRDPTR